MASDVPEASDASPLARTPKRRKWSTLRHDRSLTYDAGATCSKELTAWELRNHAALFGNQSIATSEQQERRMRFFALLCGRISFTTLFSGMDCAREAIESLL